MRTIANQSALIVPLAAIALLASPLAALAQSGSPGVLEETAAPDAPTAIEELADEPPVQFSINHPDGVYHEGDALRALIEARVDSYVYVLYHQADGETILLFPNFRNQDNLVEAGARLLPLDEERGVRFRVCGPFGTDAVEVISAGQPFTELEELVDLENPSLPAAPTDVVKKWCENYSAEVMLFGDEIAVQIQPRNGEPVQADPEFLQ